MPAQLGVLVRRAPFALIKSGRRSRDESRCTRIGRAERSMSCSELAQLDLAGFEDPENLEVAFGLNRLNPEAEQRDSFWTAATSEQAGF